MFPFLRLAWPLIPAVVLAVSGCSPDPPGALPAAPPPGKPRKNLTIAVDGRKVTASVPEPGTIMGENGAVMIRSEDHAITIGVRRVMANGLEMIQIPAETTELRLSLSDSGLLALTLENANPVTMQLPAPPE